MRKKFLLFIVVILFLLCLYCLANSSIETAIKKTNSKAGSNFTQEIEGESNKCQYLTQIKTHYKLQAIRE